LAFGAFPKNKRQSFFSFASEFCLTAIADLRPSAQISGKGFAVAFASALANC